MSRHYDQTFADIPEFIPLEVDGWRDGVGYSRIRGDDEYYITTDGDVISFRGREPRIMKTYKNAHGHRYVDIKHGGRVEKCLVHRLVAEAFIPNPNDYPIVRHLNDVPDDNCYKNLAWGTQEDNRHDSIRNGSDFRKPVYCYETNSVYRSGAEAANALGVSKASITHCCKGSSADVRGYHVCYEEDMKEKCSDSNWISPRIRRGQKPVVAIGPNGERYLSESRTEAAEKLGIPGCGISSVLSGHLNQTHGWRFEEGSDE